MISISIGGTRRRLGVAAAILARVSLTVVAGYVALVMFLNLPLFLDFLADRSDAPRYDILLILFAMGMALQRRDSWMPFLRHDYVRWCVLIVGVYAMNYVALSLGFFDANIEERSDAFDLLERSVLFGAYGYVLFVIGRSRVERFLVLALIIGSLALIVDFLRPELLARTEDVNVSTDRSAATWLNPNLAGEALVLGLLMCWRRLRGGRLVLLYVLVGFGVLLTFSRAGLVAWFLLGGVFFYGGRMPRWAYVLPVALAMFYSTLVLYAEQVLPLFVESEARIDNMMSRLGVFESVADEGLTDNSSKGRAESALLAIEGVLAQPIVGHGLPTGVIFGSGAHNQLLQSWFTFGLPGLAIWIYTFVLLNRHAPMRIFGLVAPEALFFLWFSLFSHTLYIYNFWLIYFAFVIAGGTVATSRNRTPGSRAGRPATASGSRGQRRGRRRRWKGDRATTRSSRAVSHRHSHSGDHRPA